MRDCREPSPRVGSVTLRASALTTARQRHGMTMREAAARIGVSELRLSRLESSTRRLAPRTQAAMIGRLEAPARFVQLSLFDTGLVS